MINDTENGQTQSYPQVDHEAAKGMADYMHTQMNTNSGNLARCYLDLTAKHNRLRELAQAMLEGVDEFWEQNDGKEIVQALRDFLKEG